MTTDTDTRVLARLGAINRHLSQALAQAEAAIRTKDEVIAELRQQLATTGDGRLIPRGPTAPPARVSAPMPIQRPAPTPPIHAVSGVVRTTPQLGTGCSATPKPGTRADQVLRLLAGGPATASEIGIELGMSISQTCTLLGRLESVGRIRRQPGGRPQLWELRP